MAILNKIMNKKFFVSNNQHPIKNSPITQLYHKIDTPKSSVPHPSWIIIMVSNTHKVCKGLLSSNDISSPITRVSIPGNAFCSNMLIMKKSTHQRVLRNFILAHSHFQFVVHHQ